VHHPQPVIPQGSTPTYFVIPLSGGEHLPIGTDTIFTGQGGPAVGPLDWTSIVKAQVDAALAKSSLVAVDTPTQNYAVEYLPRLSRSGAGSSTGLSAPRAAQNGSFGSSTSTPAASSSTAPSIATNSANNELAQFLGGKLSFGQLAKNTVSDFESMLPFQSAKPTKTKPGLNLEAQVVSPALPAPIPEPGTWLIFGLIAAAAGWRLRLRGRRGDLVQR
jgi:hypothetical protein